MVVFHFFLNFKNLEKPDILMPRIIHGNVVKVNDMDTFIKFSNTLEKQLTFLYMILRH